MSIENAVPCKERTAKHSRSVELVEVIRVVTTAGDGTTNNPNRYITEYWSKDGELLAVCDPAG